MGLLKWMRDSGRWPFSWTSLEEFMASYLTANRGLWSPRTTGRRLTAFRSYAAHYGAPRTFLTAYRAPVAARPKPHPIPEGIDGVLDMIRSTKNPRHRALVALTGLLGLRVGEAIAVKPEHFNLADQTLSIRGKGDKTRVIPVPDSTWKYLVKAFELAKITNSTLVARSNSGARKAITRHAINAGLSQHVKSHDLRATLATAAFKATGNIRAVQEILGHSQVTTTEVYTNVTDSDMRNALEVIS